MHHYRTCARLVRLVVVSLGAICLCSAASAQDSALINYQGFLTDAAGQPLNGSVAITLSIYADSTGFPPLWSETHPSVAIGAGLFNILCGSKATLPASTLQAGDLFLGVKVNADQEMGPRTRIASSPRAAVATRIFGDVATSEGALKLRQGAGDSNIVLRALTDGATFEIFEPGTNPPEKMFGLRAASTSGASMSFFSHGEEVMGVEPSPFLGGVSIKLFDPQPEPPRKLFEINTEASAPLADRAAAPGRSNLLMFGPSVTGDEPQLVSLSASGTSAEFRLGPGAPLGEASPLVQLSSSALQSKLTLTGPAGGPSSPVIAIMASTLGGRVGIGTETPSQALEVVGNICYTGSIGVCSDARFKTDLRPIDDALAKVEKLNGVRYHWKTTEYPDKHFSADEQVGVLAQEVMQVVPEAVTVQSDGTYTVDYTRLTPVLLEAVKELARQNEQLLERVEALERAR